MTDRITDLFGIAGKTAVVTGGSRGIGEMIAEGFVDGDASVIITSRKVDELEATAERLRSKGAAGTVTAIPSDLSSVDGVRAFATAVAEVAPAVDVLVNNAGATWGAPLGDYPAEGWDKVMNVNVRGVYFLTEALIDQLRAAGRADDPARVINIGSVDGLRACDIEHYAYSASKAAVHHLTRQLAKRLGDEHVCVNSIAPGPFESKMTAFALATDELRDALAADVPMGRIGRADDMAGAAIFLSSKAGAYLTGTVIPVAGGVATAD